MKYINEEYNFLPVLPPQSVAAAGSATSGFIDLGPRKSVCALAQLGAVAEGKTVTVRLLTSDSPDGSGAQVWDSQVITGADGGTTSASVEFAEIVISGMGRYMGVAIVNDGEAAVTASAVIVADNNYYPGGDADVH